LRPHAKNLENEIQRSPLQLQARQAKIKRQEELFREAQDHIKHLKVASHEKESQLKTIHSQISKHEKQLKESGSSKEFDALRKELAAEKEKYTNLENEILNDLMQIDDEVAKLPEAEKALAQAKAEYTDFEKNAEGRIAGLTKHLDQTKQKIKEVEATLP